MISNLLSKKITNPINVLILGKGYVGNALYNFLLNSDDIIIHHKSRKDLDYSTSPKLEDYLVKHNIEYVINCAGFTGRPNVDEAEKRKAECWDLNVTIPLRVSETCSKLSVNYIHISSGCVYSGYEKQYTEEDLPNFGLFDHSSFYSKTKHAFELLNSYGCVLRVRMPFCEENVSRNYLIKILNYPNIIDYKNSKTSIIDLCQFINYIISKRYNTNSIGLLNFTNPNPLTTKEVVSLMKKFKLNNPYWKFVDISDIKIIAPRSNCELSVDKLKFLFPDFSIRDESTAIEEALKKLTFKNNK